LLIPLIADILFRKLTDIKPYITLISPVIAVILCFVFYLIKPNGKEDNYMFFGENYIFFLLALISLAVRCVYSIFDFSCIGKLKQVIAGLLVAVIGIGSVACGFIFEDDINRYLANRNLGIADKTGSWGAVNQNVERGKNWKQIVTDTPFRLGEITSTTDEDGYENKYCDKGTYPHIDGSTVCVPMAVEFARQHLKFEDRTANQFVTFSTTHYAYENLMTEAESQNYVHYKLDAFINMGSTDLVIATEPSDDEIAQAEGLGVTLKKTPVCYDAFVFITHKDNPVDSLTVEEIKKIYTGKITNWKEVGGKDEKIRAFQREKNSGSQTAMENLVMGSADMIDPIEVRIIVGMGELVDAVAEYENETASLGYTYRYYIDTLYKNDNIKTIAVDGIAPTDENIRSEVYPFTTNYYGVIRQGDEDKIGGQFLKWILSDEGQRCVAQAGYITLS
jgi:phosphate transport system substrate-binding protein